jgi:hypothetical protein
VFRRQGVKGFYGGLSANVVRALPETSLQFLLYERFKTLLTEM